MTPSVMVPRDGAATGELAGIAEQVDLRTFVRSATMVPKSPVQRVSSRLSFFETKGAIVDTTS